MLKKMVNGKEITCEAEEEKNIKAYWELNDSYPEYAGHCGFDGINPPAHNMVECKKQHLKYVKNSVDLAVAEINKSIEEHQENEKDISFLLAIRKRMKNFLTQDLSSINNIEDLKKSIPSELKPYWTGNYSGENL
jgi:hypothetical protein